MASSKRGRGSRNTRNRGKSPKVKPVTAKDWERLTRKINRYIDELAIRISNAEAVLVELAKVGLGVKVKVTLITAGERQLLKEIGKILKMDFAPERNAFYRAAENLRENSYDLQELARVLYEPFSDVMTRPSIPYRNEAKIVRDADDLSSEIDTFCLRLEHTIAQG